MYHGKWKHMKEQSTKNVPEGSIGSQGKHSLGQIMDVERLESMEKVAHYCEHTERKV